MFQTVVEERLFMGLIHLVTGECYWYLCLPMGSCNSLATSGYFGASFVCMILEMILRFQREARQNAFMNYF